MTGREMAEWLDREGFLMVGDLKFAVRVVDVARNFGALHVTVAPVVGSGEQRVDSLRVELLPRGVTVAEHMARMVGV